MSDLATKGNAKIFECLDADPRPSVGVRQGDECIIKDVPAIEKYTSAGWVRTHGPDSSGDLAVKTTVGIASEFSGLPSSKPMSAILNTGTPSGSAQVWQSAAGTKKALIYADSVLADGTTISIGYSLTSATDTNTIPNVKNYSVELAGTRLGTDYNYVDKMDANKPFAIIEWDGANTIKQITAVINTGTTLPFSLITLG